MSPIHLIDEIGHVQGSTVCRLHSPFKSSGNGVVNLLFLYVVTPYNLACPNRRCGLISRGAFWPVAMCHGCSWVPERLKKKKKHPGCIGTFSVILVISLGKQTSPQWSAGLCPLVGWWNDEHPQGLNWQHSGRSPSQWHWGWGLEGQRFSRQGVEQMNLGGRMTEKVTSLCERWQKGH
jgi:hypothetical protein